MVTTIDGTAQLRAMQAALRDTLGQLAMAAKLGGHHAVLNAAVPDFDTFAGAWKLVSGVEAQESDWQTFQRGTKEH